MPSSIMDSVEDEFARWERVPPPDLFGDTIWRLPAYRISRYLALRVRRDIVAVRRRSRNAAEQLESSVDSVGINITEGYGRLHGRERARFYEYALGSAREARDWYARTSGWLPPRHRDWTSQIPASTNPTRRPGAVKAKFNTAASPVPRDQARQTPVAQ